MSDYIFIAWLVALVALVIIELMTMGLTTIWFAGGALVGAILALCKAPLLAQVIVALIVSIVLLVTTRPIAVKYFNKDRELTNAEGLAGQKAIVISDIDNIHESGQVKVGGQEWTARSEDDSQTIPQGTVVEIVRVSGVKLIVKPQNTNEN